MIVAGFRYDWWLCIIGVLVFVGAGGEQQAAALRSAAGALRVADVMVHDPTTLEVSFPLAAVAPFLEASPGRVLPVVDRGRYAGTIAADRLPGPPGAVLVGDATDRDTPTLAPDDPLYPVAVERLLPARRRAAVVLDGDRVVGVLYAPHLEAALRRATANLRPSSVRR